MKRLIASVLLLSAAATAEAGNAAPTSPSPSSGLPSHPELIWGLGISGRTSQAPRAVWVAPQTVVVDMVVPMAQMPPAEIQAAGTDETSSEVTSTEVTSTAVTPQYGVWRQTAVVPGYWVHQTSDGAYYPQRWILEQTADGAYRWRVLPAEFRGR